MFQKYNIKKSLVYIKMDLKKQRIKKINFAEVFSGNQIGPNGKSKEWIELANSSELVQTFEKKGLSEYMKELKKKFEEKGFYKEWIR